MGCVWGVGCGTVPGTWVDQLTHNYEPQVEVEGWLVARLARMIQQDISSLLREVRFATLIHFVHLPVTSISLLLSYRLYLPIFHPDFDEISGCGGWWNDMGCCHI